MKEDLFTFSIQQAETLGLECAIVLAAAKTIKTELASPEEITASLKEKIPFLEEQEILKNIKRLIDLKLISSEVISKKNEPARNKNLYSLKLPSNNFNAGKESSSIPGLLLRKHLKCWEWERLIMNLLKVR